MTVALTLSLFALLMMAVLLYAVRGERGRVSGLQELEGSARPVDLESFRNLVDPAEEDYLRRQLPPEDFREVQRERLRAALGYVERVAYNASLLLRVGEAARANPDPEVARAAGELVQDALRLRLYALLAAALLRARILVPAARWSPARVVSDYQGVRERVARLSRLQLPEQAGRIAAAL